MSRHASATNIVACAVAIATTACAAILGIDDVTVKDAGTGSADASELDGKNIDSGSDAIALDPYATVVLSDAPIGYWRFDDVGSMAIDSSSHGLDATYGPGVVHGPTLVSNTDGGASADFPGSPDGGFQGAGITLSPNPLLEIKGGLTIEAWIRPFAGNRSELVTYGQQVVAPYQPWGLEFAPPIELFTSCCGLVDGTTPFAVDVTYYLAATFDPSAGIVLYVNGARDGDGGTSGTLGGYDLSNGLGIGVGPNGLLPFNGLIDEVAIYDKTLSPDRILAHYDAGK